MSTTAPACSIRPVLVDHARGASLVENQVLYLGLEQLEAGQRRQQVPDTARVEPPVGLGARTTHGGALAAVQHPELDAARVDRASHQPVQRVDLAHQMAAAKTADRRIAGHRADGFEPLGHQRRPRTHPRAGRSGLAASVTTADNDDVEAWHGGFVRRAAGRVKRKRELSRSAALRVCPRLRARG